MISKLHKEAEAFLGEAYLKWSSPNHHWGIPQIANIDVVKLYQPDSWYWYSNDKDLVWFTQVCDRCGSTRLKSISKRENGWNIHDAKILHSNQFKRSDCYKYSSSSAVSRKRREKFEEERLLRLREEHERASIQKAFIYRHQELNKAILEKFRGKRLKNSSIDNLRRNLAIYRLYQYCDVPIRLIRAYAGLSAGRIRDVIGSTFRLLCMSDTSCIFRPLFFELQNKGEKLDETASQRTIENLGVCVMKNKRRSNTDIVLTILSNIPFTPASINALAKKSRATWRTTKRKLEMLAKAGLVEKEVPQGCLRAKYRRKKR